MGGIVLCFCPALIDVFGATSWVTFLQIRIVHHLAGHYRTYIVVPYCCA